MAPPLLLPATATRVVGYLSDWPQPHLLHQGRLPSRRGGSSCWQGACRTPLLLLLPVQLLHAFLLLLVVLLRGPKLVAATPALLLLFKLRLPLLTLVKGCCCICVLGRWHMLLW